MVGILSVGRLLGGSILGGAFSPLSLFAANEPGVWYDPSDLSTMFQDAAGTTPVTAVEQPVGLRLDKSRGLVLGSERITNGDFSNGTTGWTKGRGDETLTVVSGELRVTAGAYAGPFSYQDITTVAGTWYKISAQVRRGTSSAVTSLIAGTTGFANLVIATSSVTTLSTLTVYYYATTTTTRVYVQNNAASGETFFFTGVTAKSIAGSHAFQTTDINRPVLSARYNLLTRTEELTNVVWGAGVGTAVSADAEVAPTGTTTADKIYRSASGTGQVQIKQGFVFVSGISYTMSCCVKQGDAAGTAYIGYDDVGGVGRLKIEFNFSTLVASVTVGTASVSVSSLGSGWYRVVATFTSLAGDGLVLGCGSATAQNTGHLFWGADLRVSNDGVGLPAYQRVTTATDYDAGDQWPKYLRYNGTNSAMQTASIDFSSTDKLAVFAGVRRLGTGTQQLVELSTNSATNSAVFSMPTDVSTSTWTFVSKGTSAGVATTAGNYASPVTTVNTGLGNISGDSAELRINGIQVASNTDNQGTGNFGNYPLYLGARAGSSLWFNGRDYGICVLGRTATAAEIANMESWLNAKTGAY